MKKSILFLSLIACAALTAAEPAKVAAPAAAPAVKAAAKPAEKPAAVSAKPASATASERPAVVKEEEPGIAFCLARGLCNISTGWLEIPRCMIFDNGFIPFFGLIVGIPEGAFLAVGRTFCGVFDIISFGTTGNTCHGEIFPNTIFQSHWVYRRK